MAARNKPTGNDVVSVADIFNGNSNADVGDFQRDPGFAGDEETPGEIALNDVLGELGDEQADAKVYAYMLDPKTNKNIYLKTYTVQEYKEMNGLDGLREEWGGGNFQLRVMQGRTVLTRRIVSIAALPKRVETAPAIDIQSILAQQQAMMMAGFERMAQSMQAPKQESMGIKDVLEIITVMQPMMGGGHREAAAPTDPLAMMKMVLEMSKEMKSAAGGESSDVDLLAKAIDVFGKPIAEMVSQGNAAKQAVQLQAPALPNPSPRVNHDPDPQPAPTTIEDNDMGLMATAYKKIILGAAAANADPETYAGMILDHFSDEQIQDFFVKPTWFEEVKTFIPESAQFELWFRELRECALKMLQDEQNPASVPANTTTGTGNATG